MSRADNAMMAKVRARYGRRLREEDYRRLIACRGVGEITAYLKALPDYQSELEQAQEEMIHRGLLETLIRRRVLNIYMRLMKYSHDDRLFLDLYIRRAEISQLLLAMRLLGAGEMRRYIVSLPVYLARFMKFDLFALAKINDFDDLLSLLERTPYYSIVGRFRPYLSGRIDIVGCERALLTDYYATMLRRVEADYHGKTKDDLTQILKWQIDFHNMNAVYRLGRYFRYRPEQIRENLIDLRGNLRGGVLEGLVTTGDTEELLARMRELRVLKGLFEQDDPDAVRMTTQMDKARLRLAQRPFRFSTRPVVVVAAYMTTLEIELSNLVHIIEGVRYGVPADEIYRLLVI